MVNGRGSPATVLTEAEVEALIEDSTPQNLYTGKKILVLTPDTTRTCPLPMMVRAIGKIIGTRCARLDFMVALGTHPPLPESDILSFYGISDHQRQAQFCNSRFFNHRWDRPDTFKRIGYLEEAVVENISGGRLKEKVAIDINRIIFDYDLVVILGPVFPHEVVGFSGGAKYLFPGISGPELIDIIHWLGALLSSGKVIGKIDTPSRRVLDAAAAKMPLPMHGLSFVYHEGEVVAMEAGELQAAWKRAAAESQRRHITYKPRGFRKLLACCPPMYKDAWTAGKCVYKCEPVVADGGELVVYAPHVKTFSETHEEAIRAMGYHVRDYFLAHMDRYAHLPRSIMTHCIIVKGEGTYEAGVERPRIRVLLASQIKPEVCETAGLGYVDPATIDPAEWMNREEEGILYVERAGEMLYRVTS
jgi:nickel-dependent lactate racemase